MPCDVGLKPATTGAGGGVDRRRLFQPM